MIEWSTRAKHSSCRFIQDREYETFSIMFLCFSHNSRLMAELGSGGSRTMVHGHACIQLC